MLPFLRRFGCTYELRDGSVHELGGGQWLRFDDVDVALVSRGRATLRGGNATVIHVAGGSLALENLTLESVSVLADECASVSMRRCHIEANQYDRDLVTLHDVEHIDLHDSNFTGGACTEACLRIVDAPPAGYEWSNVQNNTFRGCRPAIQVNDYRVL